MYSRDLEGLKCWRLGISLVTTRLDCMGTGAPSALCVYIFRLTQHPHPVGRWGPFLQGRPLGLQLTRSWITKSSRTSQLKGIYRRPVIIHVQVVSFSFLLNNGSNDKRWDCTLLHVQGSSHQIQPRSDWSCDLQMGSRLWVHLGKAWRQRTVSSSSSARVRSWLAVDDLPNFGLPLSRATEVSHSDQWGTSYSSDSC